MITGPELVMDLPFEAGADLRSYQYYPVVLNSTGKVVLPTVDLAFGLRPAGFLMNKPNSGEAALVRKLGIITVKAELVTFRTPAIGDPGVLYTTDGIDVRMATGRVRLEDLSHATAPVLDYPAIPGSILMTDAASADLTFTAYNAITRTGTTTNGNTSNDKVSYDIDAPVWGHFLEAAAADDDEVLFFVNCLSVGFGQVVTHLN